MNYEEIYTNAYEAALIKIAGVKAYGKAGGGKGVKHSVSAKLTFPEAALAAGAGGTAAIAGGGYLLNNGIKNMAGRDLDVANAAIKNTTSLTSAGRAQKEALGRSAAAARDLKANGTLGVLRKLKVFKNLV